MPNRPEDNPYEGLPFQFLDAFAKVNNRQTQFELTSAQLHPEGSKDRRDHISKANMLEWQMRQIENAQLRIILSELKLKHPDLKDVRLPEGPPN